MREQAVKLGLATLLMVVASTEMFSLPHWLGRPAVVLTWLALVALWAWKMRAPWPAWKWDRVSGPLIATAIVLWLVEGLTAIVSPPNSSDAMAYHMPRVIYWIQQRSVEFFATPYLNQIMLQPLHEYVTLHLQLLSGGDRFANCVAWLSTGGYIVAASLVARALGAGGRGQAMAAFLAATLPNGIMQASGAKNEALLSFLLASLVYFALKGDRWLAAVACGLACFTKGTAFLFAGPLLLLLAPRAIPHAALAVLVISGPLFLRNLDLSGSPLGFDSAHADGKFRWRNEYLSWQPTVSNAIRHLSDQLGSGSAVWNRRVYDLAVGAHGALGLRVDDPATTWPYETLAVPRKTLHETDGNNRWHLGVLLCAAGWLAWKRERRALALLLALVLGAAAFCAYLKWQPFMARMWLPLFVISSGLAVLALARAHVVAQVALCLLLLDGCRLPLLKSWIRPLQGPESMFRHSREELYFNDMTTWKVRPKFEEVISILRASPCREIAVDINQFQLEYPIQAVILKDHPETKFVHINTSNPSKKYESRMGSVRPCITICLACERWIR